MIFIKNIITIYIRINKVFTNCQEIISIINNSRRFMLLNDCSLINYIGSPHIFEQLYQIVKTRIEYERQLAEDRMLKVRVLNQWLEDYDIIEKLKS